MQQKHRTCDKYVALGKAIFLLLQTFMSPWFFYRLTHFPASSINVLSACCEGQSRLCYQTASSQIAFCCFVQIALSTLHQKNKTRRTTCSAQRRIRSRQAAAVWGSYNTLIRSITWFNCIWSLSQVPASVSCITWHDIWSLYNVATSPVRRLSQDVDRHSCLQ